MKRLLLLVLLAPLSILPVVQAGCQGQSEGQLCSSLNGNDDCQPPLTCRTQGGANEGVCCSAESSVPACLGSGTTTTATGTTTTTTTHSTTTSSTTSSSATSSTTTSSTTTTGSGGGGAGGGPADDGGTGDAGDAG